MNPAVTFAIWLNEGRKDGTLLYAIFIMAAQCVGAFLGLEFGLLLRVVYNNG